MSVYNSIIYNSQIMETIQMHMKWWMNKQNMVYPHDGILFYYKNEQKQKKKKNEQKHRYMLHCEWTLKTLC